VWAGYFGHKPEEKPSRTHIFTNPENAGTVAEGNTKVLQTYSPLIEKTSDMCISSGYQPYIYKKYIIKQLIS
jgi:hypothetical protein